MCFISASAPCTALYPSHYERPPFSLLIELSSTRKVAKIRHLKWNVFLSTAIFESPKKGATFCFGLEAISNGPEVQTTSLPVKKMVTLCFTVRPEAREASVEVILIARLRKPIRCLCRSYHCAKSILCKNTNVISISSVFCFSVYPGYYVVEMHFV